MVPCCQLCSFRTLGEGEGIKDGVAQEAQNRPRYVHGTMAVLCLWEFVAELYRSCGGARPAWPVDPCGAVVQSAEERPEVQASPAASWHGLLQRRREAQGPILTARSTLVVGGIGSRSLGVRWFWLDFHRDLPARFDFSLTDGVRRKQFDGAPVRTDMTAVF